MFNIAAALDVIRKGEVVANPATWKNVQVGINSVSALLLGLVNFVPAKYAIITQFVTADSVNQAAALALTAYNVYVTMASSSKVGLPSK